MSEFYSNTRQEREREKRKEIRKLNKGRYIEFIGKSIQFLLVVILGIIGFGVPILVIIALIKYVFYG